MEKYEVSFKKSVAKDLRRIPNEHVKRILERIEGLRKDPRPVGSEMLSAQERYRLRQGDYRIIYEIEDRILVVLVVKIGHRREVYKGK